MVSLFVEWCSMVVSYGVVKKLFKLMDMLVVCYFEFFNWLWGLLLSCMVIFLFDVVKWFCIKVNGVGVE